MKLIELYAAMTVVGLRPWGGKTAKHSSQDLRVGDFKGDGKDPQLKPKKRKAVKFWKQRSGQ